MIWKAVTLLGVAACVLGDGHHHAYSEQKVVMNHHEHSGHHGELAHIGNHKPEHHQEYAWTYPSYEFSYKVMDPHTHDFKGQQEHRDGDVVKGWYWLVQPDGIKRIVKYHADKHSGFKAQVHYEGPQHHPHVEHHPHIEHHPQSERLESNDEQQNPIEMRNPEVENREVEEENREREMENREREGDNREPELDHRMHMMHKMHKPKEHKPVLQHLVPVFGERERENQDRKPMIEHHKLIPIFDFERIKPKIELKEHKKHKPQEEYHIKPFGYHREIYHPHIHKEENVEHMPIHKHMERKPMRNEEDEQEREREENNEERDGYQHQHKHRVHEPYYGHKHHYYKH